MMSIPGMKCSEKSSFSYLVPSRLDSCHKIIRHRGDDAITGAWGKNDFGSEARDERQQKDTNLYQSLH